MNTHTKFGVLLSMHAWVMASFFPRDLDVGECIIKENVPIETFNISFESTQNMQQYGTKIACTEVRKKLL